jgi:hypothetical protein
LFPATKQGAIINVLGAGATMLGLSATIGVLLAKTLTSATVNPFLATSSSNWNPVLAFDVFNVQVRRLPLQLAEGMDGWVCWWLAGWRAATLPRWAACSAACSHVVVGCRWLWRRAYSDAP